MKHNVKLYMAIASFTASILFALLALFLPPMGIIDPSVNFFIAQLLLLAATLLGVDAYVTKIRHQ